MKSPIRLILLLALLAALGAVPPVGAEPSGFAAFDWGTPRAVIEQAMKTQWRIFEYPIPPSRAGLRSFAPITAPMSDLGLGSVDVKLDYINDGLHGVHHFRPPRRRGKASGHRATNAAASFLGARTGARPSGMASHTLDTCLPGFFCSRCDLLAQ
jgi:hypothetical protein